MTPGAASRAVPQTAPRTVPRPLEIGKLLDGAFAAARGRFLELAGFALVVAVPLQAAVGIPFARALERQASEPSLATSGSLTAAILLVGLTWFLAPQVEAATAGPAAVRAWLIDPGDPSSDLSAWARRAPAIAATLLAEVMAADGMLVGSIVLATVHPAGWLLALFAALPLCSWLGAMLCFAPLEAGFGAGPVRALGASWRLVRGAYWRVVGILTLTQLVCVGALLGPALLAFSARPGAGPGARLWLVTCGVLLETVAAPFRAGALAALWIDLRCRREGLDLEMRLEPASRIEAVPR
jgi:hypothetical protein